MEWYLQYEDGTTLSQITEGKEVLFKEIQQDRIKEFILTGDGLKISVFPETGTFIVNSVPLKFESLEEAKTEGYGKFNLIYFIRRRQTIGDYAQRSSEYYLGLRTVGQANTIACRKGIIKIKEDGQVEISKDTR